MKSPKPRILPLAAAILAALSPLAHALTTWFGGNGNWSNDANWIPAGQPTAGQDVLVITFDPINAQNLIYDNAVSGAAINSLNIHSDTTTMNFLIPSGSTRVLTVTGTESIGSTGSGSFDQEGGQNNVGVSLTLALKDVDAHATYQLGAGTLTAPKEVLGDIGSATFYQNAGSNIINSANAADGLILANNSHAIGYYNLTGGSLTVNAPLGEQIGRAGQAIFNHSVGNNTVGSIFASRNLTLGNPTYTGLGDSGDYNLFSGNLTVYGSELLAGSSDHTANFTQSGGANTINSAFLGLALGTTDGGDGVYELDGGTLTSSGHEILGYAGNSTATFNQTGGTNSLTSGANLYIQESAGGYSSYNLSAGNLSVSGAIFIGHNSLGYLNQTGGNITANGMTLDTSVTNLNGGNLTIGTPASHQNLIISPNPGDSSSITQTLNQQTTVNGNLYIGDSPAGPGGFGALSVTSGSFTVTGSLNIGGSITPGSLSGLTLGSASLTLGGLNIQNNSVLALASPLHPTTPNATSLSGSSFLNPGFTGPAITYSGNITGSAANLIAIAGPAGILWQFADNPANHSIDVVITKVIGIETAVAPDGATAPSPGAGTINPYLAPSHFTKFAHGAGQVAFIASLTNTTDNAQYALFLSDARTLSTLMRDKQPAPGGGTYSTAVTLPSLYFVDSTAQALFSAAVINAPSGNYTGFFRGDKNATVKIVATGDPAPGAGAGTLGLPSAIPNMLAISPSGKVAFADTVNNASNGSASGLFRSDGLSLVPIARQNQAIPSGGNFASGFLAVSVNDAGQVAFVNSDDTFNPIGIFRGDGVSITSIAFQGAPAPGIGGGTLGLSGVTAKPFSTIDALGRVSFIASTVGSSDGSVAAIYRGSGSALSIIARDKQPAPGAGGGDLINLTQQNFPQPYVANPAGQIAFVSRLENTSDGSTDGVFLSDGNSLLAIAREKQSSPGVSAGTFGNKFAQVRLNNTGQLAFLNNTQSAYPGVTIGTGLFLADSQQIIEVARDYEFINGRQFAGLSSLFDLSVNDFGQVSFEANLPDSPFIFTPTLHWRSPITGSWDEHNNWTVGLTPARVHDVVIDPASALTVFGPAANIAVKSLSIGSTAATATFRLTTGNLKINALTLTGSTSNWTSLLDVATQKIVVEDSATHAATLATLKNQAAFGLTQNAGILSSSRNGAQTLVVSDNAIAGLTTFGGLPVDASSILLTAAYFGDANLDGKVNITDLNILANHWQQPAQDWSQANFNGDSITNITDLNMLGNNWQAGVGGSVDSSPQASILGTSPVPEPATLALFASSLVLLVSRRAVRREPA